MRAAGVVLLDSAHPDRNKRLLAALPPPRTCDSTVVREIRAQLKAKTFPNPDGVDGRRSSHEARAAGPLGDVPLMVVTAGDSEIPLPPPIARRQERAWFRLQDDVARLSTDSVHVVATSSPHAIQSNLGQPELVIHAIRVVLRAVRSHGHLPPCHDLFHRPGARCVP